MTVRASRWRRLGLTLLIAGLVHGALVALYRPLTRSHRVVVLDEAFLADDAPIDLLVIGDSHPRSAFDEEVLGARVFDLAVAGEHMLKTMVRLRWLLERTDRPIRTALVPLESHTFTDWKVDAWQPEAVWGRYGGLLAVGERRGQLPAYLGRWLKAAVVPYAGELDTAHQYLVGGRGFRTRDDLDRTVVSRDVRRGPREAAALHFEGRSHLDPDLRWAYEQVLAELEARGVEVVLIAWPVSQPYAELADTYGARGAVRGTVLPELQDRGYRFLDHEGAFFGQPWAWYDGDHMSRPGRAAFTRQLADELAELGILESP